MSNNRSKMDWDWPNFLYFFSFWTENRGEFLEKLQRARAAVRQGQPSQPILTNPGPHKIIVGNWVLQSQKEQQLHIHNSEGHQVSAFISTVDGFLTENLLIESLFLPKIYWPKDFWTKIYWLNVFGRNCTERKFQRYLGEFY